GAGPPGAGCAPVTREHVGAVAIHASRLGSGELRARYSPPPRAPAGVRRITHRRRDSSPPRGRNPCPPRARRAPVTDTTPCAFLVRPRRQIGQDLARVWGPLARVPERCYDTALKRLPLPATTIARVTVDGHDGPLGEIVLVPYAAGHLLADPARGPSGWHARSTTRCTAVPVWSDWGH